MYRTHPLAASALVSLLALTACGDVCHVDLYRGAPTILAVGDSVLWWSSPLCGAVPDVVGQRTGRNVENASRVRAHLTGAKPIERQYVEGDWDWVILTGGGNDLNACGCAEGCDAELRTLASQDGKVGAMPSLVDRIRSHGPRVVVLGYYHVSPSALYGFGVCNELIDMLDERYARLAAERDGVVFVDPRAFIRPSDFWAYDVDQVHPSIGGSQELAAHVVAAMDEAR